MAEFSGLVKVPSRYKPLPIKERTTPNLVEGDLYYVSFVPNNAYPCSLLEIINVFADTEVRIKIPGKTSSSKSFFKNGTRCHDWSEERIVKAYEIGQSPEQAAQNMVL